MMKAGRAQPVDRGRQETGWAIYTSTCYTEPSWS